MISRKKSLGKWDAETQTGITQEVITRYDNMKDPNFIMTLMLDEMKKFKNPSNLSNNGNQHEQNYICSPLTGY